MNSKNYIEKMNEMIRKNCLKYKGLNVSAEEFVPDCTQNAPTLLVEQNKTIQTPNNTKSIFNYRLYDNIVLTPEFDYFVEQPKVSLPQQILFNRLENDFVKYNTWLFE